MIMQSSFVKQELTITTNTTTSTLCLFIGDEESGGVTALCIDRRCPLDVVHSALAYAGVAIGKNKLKMLMEQAEVISNGNSMSFEYGGMVQ
jgi:hypothetical protein